MFVVENHPAHHTKGTRVSKLGPMDRQGGSKQEPRTISTAILWKVGWNSSFPASGRGARRIDSS